MGSIIRNGFLAQQGSWTYALSAVVTARIRSAQVKQDKIPWRGRWARSHTQLLARKILAADSCWEGERPFSLRADHSLVKATHLRVCR